MDEETTETPTLSDDDISTQMSTTPTAMERRPGDGTDGDTTDATDGDATDGDGTDETDGDSGDADGMDTGDADGTDATDQ